MFSLVAVLALAAADTPPAVNATPVDPDQKVRCQREDVTGSLIAVKRVCHTVAEWRKMSDEAQRGAQRALDQGNICPSCQGH